MMADPETVPDTTGNDSPLVHVLCCRDLTRSYCGLDFTADDQIVEAGMDSTCIVCHEAEHAPRCWIDGNRCTEAAL